MPETAPKQEPDRSIVSSRQAPFRSARTELHVPRTRMIILYIDCSNCTMTVPGNCDHSPLLIQYDTTRHAAPFCFRNIERRTSFSCSHHSHMDWILNPHDDDARFSTPRNQGNFPDRSIQQVRLTPFSTKQEPPNARTPQRQTNEPPSSVVLARSHQEPFLPRALFPPFLHRLRCFLRLSSSCLLRSQVLEETLSRSSFFHHVLCVWYQQSLAFVLCARSYLLLATLDPFSLDRKTYKQEVE